MKRLILFAILLYSSINQTHAQNTLYESGFSSIGKPSNNTNLYNLNADQYNHLFEYKLPNDGILRIDFLRLSDWGDKNNLAQMASIAAEQVMQLKDSFKSLSSEKTLEINIPINNKVLSINYRENDKNRNQLAYKDGTYFQLKTGFDTIRILKNMAFKTKPVIDSGLVQIQYTFILKDLNDIKQWSEDKNLFERIGNTTDSVINEKRKIWHRQDATGHNLTINMDTNNNDSLAAYNNRARFLYGRHIGVYASMGATVFNSSIAPYIEMSIAYFIPTRGKMQGFVGFNTSLFGYPTTSKTLLSSGAVYTTYNGEIGFCIKGTPLLSQKTSFVLGIMTIKDEKPLFNYGFTIGVNRYASIGLNLATNFKKQEKGRSVIGVNFKLNL